jgi:predicted dehydrogenase
MVSANEKIVVGVMGCGGRGYVLTDRITRMPDIEVKYLCDPDQRRYSGVVGVMMENGRKRPETIQDFRRMLDDPEVDAVINVTNDYWHALSSIMACQAGKDVYVEKPLTQNIWEGRKMVEAARKYNRVVQVGTQSRSGEYLYKAADYVRSGKLGKVHLVKIYNMLNLRAPQEVAPADVPDSIDWDLWCGPAPLYPYRPARRWFSELWDFSVGGIFADAIHQIDNARTIFNQRYPKTVCNTGSISRPGGVRETPDTLVATYEYDDDLTVTIQGALWTPYMKKIPQSIRQSDSFPDFRFTSTKVEIYGTDGVMFFGRQGGGWMVYDDNWDVVASEYGRETTDEHLRNFFDCMKTREKPNLDIEDAHLDIVICHLANISYRVGNRKLRFDGDSERFIDDDQANALLKREYREPWVIPDKV